MLCYCNLHHVPCMLSLSLLFTLSSSAELDLQSRLKWRPLFELVQLQRPSSAGDHCVVNSSVECTLCLKYHGPKVG